MDNEKNNIEGEDKPEISPEIESEVISEAQAAEVTERINYSTTALPDPQETAEDEGLEDVVDFEAIYEEFEESQDSEDDKVAEEQKTDNKIKHLVIAIVIVAALAIVGLVAVQLVQAEKLSQAATAANETTLAQIEASKVHTHTWNTQWELVSHEPVTETVHHDAITETVLVGHTICNTCNAVLDGAAAQHIADTGHAGYTPNVKIPESHVTTAAWDETITVTPAYDELVANTEKCADCGEVRSIDQITKSADSAAVQQ